MMNELGFLTANGGYNPIRKHLVLANSIVNDLNHDFIEVQIISITSQINAPIFKSKTRAN